MAADDASLVRDCLRDDPRAVRALIERFQHDVLGLCLRVLGHRHDAEDVTQEVFLRIFRSLRRWDAARPLRPWVLGIAVNRCRTWLSQRSRRPETVDYLQETVAARPADDSGELLAEIDLAMQSMRAEYRSVLVLFHEQGQTYEQIALALECPVGTVKTWLYRARSALLEQLRSRGAVADVISEESPDPSQRQ